MKIAIASDHKGFRTKKKIKKILRDMGVDTEDLGCETDEETCDYPDFAALVAEGVSKGKFDRGVLICGTGVGMCIVANKFKNIRAAVVDSMAAAEKARMHGDINVLCLGGDNDKDGYTGIIKRFLECPPLEKHAVRIEKINQIERKLHAKPKAKSR